MNRRNVLHLTSSAGFFGAENIVLELCKELAGTNYAPTIGVFKNRQNPHTELAEMAQKYNLDAEIFECKGRLDTKTIYNIREFIRNKNVKIVHAHGYKTRFYALLSTLFEDMILITTYYVWHELQYSKKAKLYFLIDKFVVRRFDRVLTDCSKLKKEILSMGIPEERISVINNGIDLRRFEKAFNLSNLRKLFKISDKQQVVGAIGRLDIEKGHAILIEAAKMIVQEFPNVLFVIVGDGPLREKLQKKVLELNLQDHVLFTGICNNIPEILALMDLFVLPSLSEGMPMALLEAMAAKKPVIATNVGDIPKIIRPNETGILIDPNNAHQLRAALSSLLTNKTKATSLARKGYHIVKERFSSKHMAQKYIEVYDSVLTPNPF